MSKFPNVSKNNLTGPPGLLFSMQSAIGFPDADFVIAVVANGTLIITCRRSNCHESRFTRKLRRNYNHPIPRAKPESCTGDKKGSDPDEGEAKLASA